MRSSYRGKSLKGFDPARCVASGLVQVPEGRRIFTRLTVEENLKAGGLAVRGRDERSGDYDRIYEMFPVLAERRSQRAGLLSGGEQQMLAIGRGLMSRPQLLLLDEPSLGLAPRIIGQIGEVIREINQHGTSVLLVEQNATMALGVADDAFVLDVGKVGRCQDRPLSSRSPTPCNASTSVTVPTSRPDGSWPRRPPRS